MMKHMLYNTLNTSSKVQHKILSATIVLQAYPDLQFFLLLFHFLTINQIQEVDKKICNKILVCGYNELLLNFIIQQQQKKRK